MGEDLKTPEEVYVLSFVWDEILKATEAGMQHRVNPIRKVVTMLQMMQNKVEAEGKAHRGIFDKFMCYCANAETLVWNQPAGSHG